MVKHTAGNMPIDIRDNYSVQCVKWKCLESLREVFDCWGKLVIRNWRVLCACTDVVCIKNLYIEVICPFGAVV